MNGLILAAAMLLGGSGEPSRNEIDEYMTDQYGRYRLYSEHDLTVDKTRNNLTIIRKMRRNRVMRDLDLWPKPTKRTHGGNGYRHNHWDDYR